MKELHNNILWDEERDFIINYVKPPQIPLTIEGINLKLNEKI